MEHVTRFFVLLVCASVLGVTGWRTYLARDLALRDSQIDTANIARSVADHAHATVRMADILVAGLVERVEGDGTGLASLARLHDVMVAKVAAVPRVSTLLVFDPDGEVLASSLPRLTAGAGDREYFAQHRADPDRGTHVALSVQSHSSGRWTLCVSRRFDQPDGTFGGVVLATVDTETFSAFYASFSIGAHGSIALVGEDGALFARVPVRQDSIGQSFANTPFFRGYRQHGPVGNSQGVSPTDGVMRLNSFRKVDSYPLVVGVALSQADILTPWKADAWSALAASGAIALVLAWLGWHLAGQIRLRHRSEAVVRDSERQYRLLADTSTDLIVQLGPDLRRVYASPASQALLGYEPREMVGQHPRDLPHPDDWPAVEAALASIAADGHAPPYAFRARHKDGRYVWVEAHGRKLLDEEGIVLSMRDVTRRKEAEALLHEANNRLQRAVMLDGLTGIANRRCFDLMLQREFRRAVRAELPLALLLLDVDHFKAYNDTYGHPAGDECLRAIAGVLGQQMRRAADLAARYGGEEFAVLLPDTDISGAMAFAEWVRDAVRHLGVAHRTSPGRVVTLSVGVAVIWPQRDGQTMQDLVQVADAALYEAKANGRDRVHLGTPQPALAEFGGTLACPEQPQPDAATARSSLGGASGGVG